MAKATLSLLGIYNYDGTIFDDFVVPEDVEKDVVIHNLLLETADLEILYSEPSTLRMAIGIWSAKESKIWDRLLQTTLLEYDPISNYDREETWTDSGTSSGLNSGTTTSQSTGSSTDTSTDYVVGFNSDTAVMSDKTESAGSTTDNNSGTSTVNTSGQTSSTHTGRVHGNIGVTTTQQMIEQEREVDKFCIDDYIIDSFKRRFCLLVY